jgi:hypothetical protein
MTWRKKKRCSRKRKIKKGRIRGEQEHEGEMNRGREKVKGMREK